MTKKLNTENPEHLEAIYEDLTGPNGRVPDAEAARTRAVMRVLCGGHGRPMPCPGENASAT